MFREIFNPTVNYKAPTEDQPRNIFKKYDTNNDNKLSRKKLKKPFDYLASNIPGFRPKRGLHHADANKDGNVNEREMDELVKYAKEAGFDVVGNERLPTAIDKQKEEHLQEFCEKYTEKGVLSNYKNFGLLRPMF